MVALSVAGGTAAAATTDPYRPVYHYSPAQNFMNDPNGLIYHNGIYHMFYQYNPYGTTAGNGSWGQATSTDLVHWKQQPVAIPTDATEDVWSGSVVFDKTNTSGFGTLKNPPMVAMYTSFLKADGTQRQALAYSLDDGKTWTKYAGNPVIDIHSTNFRDPKVFWYAPTHSWRVVVALSDQPTPPALRTARSATAGSTASAPPTPTPARSPHPPSRSIRTTSTSSSPAATTRTCPAG
jgi:levanase